MAAQAGGVMGNLSSSRARWRAGNAMAAHDRLPPDLRRWMIHAALPWSAESALRLWTKTLSETGCKEAALARLEAAERQTLQRDSESLFFAENSLSSKKTPITTTQATESCSS
jgi:Family of unknown function (DUF6525)